MKIEKFLKKIFGKLFNLFPKEVSTVEDFVKEVDVDQPEISALFYKDDLSSSYDHSFEDPELFQSHGSNLIDNSFIKYGFEFLYKNKDGKIISFIKLIFTKNIRDSVLQENEKQTIVNSAKENLDYIKSKLKNPIIDEYGNEFWNSEGYYMSLRTNDLDIKKKILFLF